VTVWTIPEPRPEVVELLAEALLAKRTDDEAAALHECRYSWTTGAERRLAYSLAIGELSEVREIVQATHDDLVCFLIDHDDQAR
jgi:hypothetical protein